MTETFGGPPAADGATAGVPANPRPSRDLEHGTRSCYVHNRCRDAECVDANRLYQREYRARVSEAPVPPQLHGTLNGYQTYGCRCIPCTAVHSAACADYRLTAATK